LLGTLVIHMNKKRALFGGLPVIFLLDFYVLSNSLNGDILTNMPVFHLVYLMISGALFLVLVGFFILQIISQARTKHSLTLTLMYSFGLSILFVTFVGLIATLLSSVLNLRMSGHIVWLVIILFCIIYIVFHLKSSNGINMDNFSFVHIPSSLTLRDFLFIFLYLIIVILEAYLSYYQLSDVLKYSIVLALFPLLGYIIYCNKPWMRPILIWLVSLILFIIWWGFSQVVWGTDIYSELFASSLTWETGYWNWSIVSNMNSIPIVTLYVPTMSKILMLNIIPFVKFVIPIYLSTIPVGLYLLFKRTFEFRGITINSDLYAAVSALVALLMGWAYKLSFITIRQGIAEFFFLLLLLTLYSFPKGFSKSLLVVIFSMGIILSHYGTSTFLLVLLFFVAIFCYLIPWCDRLEKRDSFTLLSIFSVLLFIWYLNVSQASLIKSLSYILRWIMMSLREGMYTAKTSATTTVLAHVHGVISVSYRLLFGLVEVLLFVGAVKYLTTITAKRKKILFIDVLSLSMLIGSAVMFVLPYVGRVMDPMRTYSLMLLGASMFFPFGLEAIIGRYSIRKLYRVIFLTFLIVMALYSTSFIYAIFNIPSGDLPMSWEYSTSDKHTLFALYMENIQGAKWVDHYCGSNSSGIYSDGIGSEVLMSMAPMIALHSIQLKHPVFVGVLAYQTYPRHLTTSKYVFLTINTMQNDEFIYFFYHTKYTPKNLVTFKSMVYNSGAVVLYGGGS